MLIYLILFFALESLLKLPFIKSHMIRGNIIKGNENEKEEDFVCFDMSFFLLSLSHSLYLYFENFSQFSLILC